jgi:hypothetical protein
MEEAIAQVPFYLDWKFWSVVISFAALILSQLPPVHIMLRKAKSAIEVYNTIHVSHMVGNPNAQLHLILQNTGGRSLRVKSISLRLRHESGAEFMLPAKNYYKEQGDSTTVLLTPFKLNSGEDWGHLINFLNFFNRTEEKEFRAITSALRKNILEKRDALSNPPDSVAAEQFVVAPVKEFFSRKFQWKPGEYEAELTVATEPESASTSKKYRFVLFESDTQELVKVVEEYQYGGGVILDVPSQAGLNIPLSEV